MKTLCKVGCCLVAAIAAFGARAEVLWDWNGSKLTEILPEGSTETAWQLNLSAAGALSLAKEGTNPVLDLRAETMPEGVPEIKSVPRMINNGAATCTTVCLPSTVTTLADYTFMNWKKLQSVNLDQTSVTAIPQSCFNGCLALTAVTLPAATTSIGSSAFNGCSALTEMALPETLTTIGGSAFYNCTGLVSIGPGLPAGLTSIGEDALRNCPKLTNDVVVGFATSGDEVVPTTLGANRLFHDSRAVKTVRVGPGVSQLPASMWSNTDPAFVDLGCNIPSTPSFPSNYSSLTNLIVRFPGDFALANQCFHSKKNLKEISWGGWFTYTVGQYVFRNWTALQCRFVIPWHNEKWEEFLAGEGKMAKLWADFTDAEKTAYFNRYGEDAVWPIGYTAAVANGLPQTYIVRNQEPDADAFQLVVKTTNRAMSTITVDPAPDATTGLYAANAPVTVSIALQPGASFVRWEGPVAEEDRTKTTIVVPMAAQKKLTAVVKVQPVIVDGSFAVSFPRGDSQAQAVFRLSGEEGAVYDATAEILWKTNGTDWAVCKTLTGLANGQTVSAWLPAPFLAGSTLDVRVRVNAVGADEVSDEVDGVAVTNPLPANFGLGGGEGIFHVRADATGDGSGRDWFNAAQQLPTSQSKLPKGTVEVWFAGEATTCIDGTAEHVVSGPLAMRGGFLGVECRPEERPTDARSLVDREDTVNYGFSTERGQNVFNVSKKVTLDGFCFRRAKVQGVVAHVGGGGLFELVNCTFESNCVASGINYNNGGRVLAVSGYAENNNWGSFACSNCVFRNNGLTGDWQKAAVFLDNLKGADLTDCSFVNNGSRWESPLITSTPNSCAGGVALYVNNAPVSINRCEFRANRGWSGNDSNNYPQGIVQLDCAFSKVAWSCGITNCLFVGNQVATAKNEFNALTSGALGISDRSTFAHSPAEIVNCTFAYNAVSATAGAAGLSVKSGTVKVRNSIFYGNRTMPSAVGGSDVFVTKSGAAVDIDYSLVTSLDKANFWAVSGATLTPGDHMQTGDPKFVTTLDDFNALVLVTNNANKVATLAFPPTDEALAAVKAFDVHVAAGSSPAIDTGDDSPYENEPSPNGERINLGVYGNTDEAHVTESAQPTVGGVTVEFPYGTTQPKVSFALGGEADYSATATLYWSTNGTDFAACGSWTALNRGAAISEILPIAFVQGDTLTMKVVVTAYGAEDAVSSSDPTELTNPMPETYGKGGEGVFHLRLGATGDGSGRDWFNAVTNVYDLYNAVAEKKGEIWIAGSNALSKASETWQPAVPLVIRGGFVGTECSPADRPKGAKSILDGAATYVPLTIANGAAAPVEVERLVFQRSPSSGLVKSGAGRIDVRDCDFRWNSPLSTNRTAHQGVGANLSGTAGVTEMSVSNCTFVGNQFFAGSNDGRYYPSGLGLYAEGAKRVTVDDTLFLTNGTPLDVDSRDYGQGLRGAAFAAIDAPVTVRRCAFRANRGYARCSWNGTAGNETYLQGGTVYLGGASGGSAFTNCLWAGNASEASVSERTTPHSSVCQGAAVVRLGAADGTVDFANCTFAGNLNDAERSPSGINVMKGAVNVTHSVFEGNIVGPYLEAGVGREIAVGEDGSATIDWTVFERPVAESVSAAVAGSLTVGDHVKAEPANLVTRPEELSGLVVTNSEIWKGISYTFVKYDPTRDGDLLPSVNAHLRGGSGYVDERTGEKVTRYRRPRSPAIDAGDSSVKCVEPKPNGHCVNLGAYGNTPWATTSPGGTMLFVR